LSVFEQTCFGYGSPMLKPPNSCGLFGMLDSDKTVKSTRGSIKLCVVYMLTLALKYNYIHVHTYQFRIRHKRRGLFLPVNACVSFFLNGCIVLSQSHV